MWFLIHDQPEGEHKFSWHRLVKNCFHISIIGKQGEVWTADIHYNTNDTLPICKTTGERKIQIYLPIGLTRTEFIKFTSELSDVDGHFITVIKSVSQKRLQTEFNFSREDLAVYRDFKRHLLLKVLKG